MKKSSVVLGRRRRLVCIVAQCRMRLVAVLTEPVSVAIEWRWLSRHRGRPRRRPPFPPSPSLFASSCSITWMRLDKTNRADQNYVVQCRNEKPTKRKRKMRKEKESAIVISRNPGWWTPPRPDILFAGLCVSGRRLGVKPK